MDEEEIEGRIAEKERTETEQQQSDEGDIDPIEVLDQLQASLDAAFKDNGGDAPKITENGSTCESGDATTPVTYCPDDNTIGIDADALQEIAAKPNPNAPPGSDNAGGLGDFAAFAEIASRYALSVQKTIGAPLDDEKAGLRTACLTGAWAGFTNEEGQELRLAIGDLDEAVAELLQEESLIAADVKGKQVESGFARVEAFRRGFIEGSGPCTEDFS
jgi:predicted metalloprotease